MLTPPEDCLNRKVSFDIVDSSESEPEYVDSSHQTPIASPPPSSSSVSSSAQSLLDLCGTRVPQEILVGLFDRAAEMRDLVTRNSGFFGILRGFVNKDKIDGEWQRFLDWIFIERDVVGDLEWIEGVGAFLGACPSYFEKFKEIVGFDEDISGEDEDNDKDRDCDRDLYDEDDDGYYNTNDNNYHKNNNRNRGRDSDDDSDSDADSDGDADHDDDDFVVGKEDGYDADSNDDERPYDTNFETVDLTLIRRFPARLASFERSYPQFFVNVRDCLCRPRGPHGITTSCPSRTPVESNRVNPSGRVEQKVCTVEERERPYDEFVKVLFSPRRVLPDDEWERALLECLEGWPNLLAQLKEIVAFEVEDSWGEE